MIPFAVILAAAVAVVVALTVAGFFATKPGTPTDNTMGERSLYGPKWCRHVDQAVMEFGPTCLCDRVDCWKPAVVWACMHGTWFHYCAEHQPARKSSVSVLLRPAAGTDGGGEPGRPYLAPPAPHRTEQEPQ